MLKCNIYTQATICTLVMMVKSNWEKKYCKEHTSYCKNNEFEKKRYRYREKGLRKLKFFSLEFKQITELLNFIEKRSTIFLFRFRICRVVLCFDFIIFFMLFWWFFLFLTYIMPLRSQQWCALKIKAHLLQILVICFYENNSRKLLVLIFKLYQ